MRRHVTIRSHLYDFLEARPPAKNHVQEMGLHFERLTIGLIIVSILSFVLSTEVKLYSDDGWRGLFDFVEWVLAIKKRLHPSMYEECRRLYNESILLIDYLAIINCFLLPSTSYLCTCKSC